MSRAVLHIGLPKTGTSYLQQSLVGHRPELARTGVDLLNVAGVSQHHAAWDLVGRRAPGVGSQQVEGAWTALAERASGSTCHTVLLSDETLVHARAPHVRAVTRSLAPRDVQVIVTVRDFARAITSMWEQNTAKGRSIPWPDYVAAVRDPSSGAPTSGVAFWLRYDLRRILGTWGTGIPAENVRLVVVPPRASPPSLLLQRFGEAAGLDLDGVRPPDHHVHASLGAVHTEVLRQINEHIRGQMTEAQYVRTVNGVVRPAFASLPRSATVTFPPEHRAWVVERSEELIGWLSEAPYEVVGDLDDLRPCFGGSHEEAPDELSEEAVLTASRDLLHAILTTVATNPPGRGGVQRDRRSAGQAQPSDKTSRSSRRRSVSFRARVKALEMADRHRWMGRLAALYLKWTNRSGRGVR